MIVKTEHKGGELSASVEQLYEQFVEDGLVGQDRWNRLRLRSSLVELDVDAVMRAGLYRCSGCQRNFPSEGSLRRHVEFEHGGPG